MEQQKEEAQRMRADQVQAGLPDEIPEDDELFEAPRRAAKPDVCGKKMKELFGKFNDLPWVSRTSKLESVNLSSSGRTSGNPLTGLQRPTTEPLPADPSVRINGTHKYPHTIKTNVSNSQRVHSIRPSSGSGSSRDQSQDKKIGGLEVRPSLSDHSENFSRSSLISQTTSSMQLNPISSRVHLSGQLVKSPVKNSSHTSVNSNQIKHSSAPFSSDQQPSSKQNSEQMDYNQLPSYQLPIAPNKSRPDDYQVKPKGREGSGLRTPPSHLSSSPLQRNLLTSHSAARGAAHPPSVHQGQSRQKQLTLNIKPPSGSTEPKDLENIFKEMDLQPPVTAIQTPVKFNVNQFAFATMDNEAKLKPPLSPVKEPEVPCDKNDLKPNEKRSVLDDLVLSDTDNEQGEINSEAEEPVKGDSSPAVSSGGESSNESDTENDSQSVSSSSSSSSKEEEEEAEKKEALPEDKPAQPTSVKETSQSSWGLKRFLQFTKQAPSPVSNVARVGVAGSSDENAKPRPSPRKIGEIGHSGSMPFTPSAASCRQNGMEVEEASSSHNQEKAEISPNVSITTISQHSTPLNSIHRQSHLHSANDKESAPDPSKNRTSASFEVKQNNIKSGPGRPNSVSSDRSDRSSHQNDKGIVKEVESKTVIDRKHKRTSRGIPIKKKEKAVYSSSSGSDVDVESFTPDPKTKHTFQPLTEQQQQKLAGVNKQLFKSPEKMVVEESKPLLTESKVKSHFQKDGGCGSSETPLRHKRESMENRDINTSALKAKCCSNSHIKNFIHQTTEEFKPPAKLSPLRSFDLQQSEKKTVPNPFLVPTSICGRPSIVVRIRNASSYRCISSTLHPSKTCPVQPQLHYLCMESDNGLRSKGVPEDAAEHLVISKDRNIALSQCSSTDLSSKVSVSKRRRENDQTDSSKKHKPNTSTVSKMVSKMPVSQPLENGLSLGEDVKRPAKRSSERRSSCSSTSSRSSHKLKKVKQEFAVHMKSKANEMPKQNGQDVALPFNTYSIVDQSPSVSVTPDEEDPLLPTEDSLRPAEFYLQKAKEFKHIADKMVEKATKLVPYIKSILYFILGGQAIYKLQHHEPLRSYSMFSDTYNLVSFVSSRCVSASSSDSKHIERERKLSVLISYLQSLLCLRLFNLKKAEALKFKKVIESEQSKTPTVKIPSHAPSPHQNYWNKSSTGVPSPMSPTPSPTCSIGSVGSQGSSEQPSGKLTNGNLSGGSSSMVMVPQRIHSVTQKYMTITSFLVQCHELWDQAQIDSQPYREFFSNLDNRCGPLSLHSDLLHLVCYVNLGLKEITGT